MSNATMRNGGNRNPTEWDRNQLLLDRWTAILAIAFLIALVALIFGLAAVGAPQGETEYWPMMP